MEERQKLSRSIPRCLQGCRRGLGCYNGKIAGLQELWEKMTFFSLVAMEMVIEAMQKESIILSLRITDNRMAGCQ